jgi:ferric-dicitrate binding protein FerR (iron transport regulator)
MDMPEISDSRLEYLFKRYVEGACTQPEKDELLGLIGQARFDDQLKSLMDQVWGRLSSTYQLDDEQSERILAGILAPRKVAERRISLTRYWWWSGAAAVIIVLIASTWLWHSRSRQMIQPAVTAAVAPLQTPAPAARSGVVLILGNGSSVVLDSAHNGVIAQQGGTAITKNNGRLSYTGHGTEKKAVVYNTIVTPRGGDYQVVLPDGSKVWLNAVSSLRFPTSFTGPERSVELTGEAYFEVAANSAKPFKVNAKGMEVNVLGTHFDVMAYQDEPLIRTTLLEGSVRVSDGKGQVVLVPGQQASLDRKVGGSIAVSKADLEAAVAWKNGLFLFHDTDIRSVLREISRWYDADVVYEGDVNGQLNGMISRKADLEEVFHMLEVTSNLKLAIEDKKIIVRNGK